ncbi:MAG: ABC transporter ATP-binding protein [Pseudomonadota bacterium]
MTLSIRDLTVGYGGTDVLTDVAFDAPRGRLTALIGANGAGKSTLLKAIAGIARTTGAVMLDGAPFDAREHVAYMPQDTSAASGLTMLETVMLGRLRNLGWSTPRSVIEDAAALLDRFGLAALAERPLHSVSGGQRQLAFLAQALLRRPRALLLDEPTAALDLRHQLLVLEAVRADAESRDVVVIAAMHDLGLVAQFADHIVCISGGSVVGADAPEALLTDELIAATYGVAAEVARTERGLRITPIAALP